MVESSVGAKLVTSGTKVRGRNAKQQQGVGINETDVKVRSFLGFETNLICFYIMQF